MISFHRVPTSDDDTFLQLLAVEAERRLVQLALEDEDHVGNKSEKMEVQVDETEAIGTIQIESQSEKSDRPTQFYSAYIYKVWIKWLCILLNLPRNTNFS